MTNRRIDKILIKKSGVVGNVPTSLDLGELALNYADVKLYASGTTTNTILPIGWDRISRTGDTVTGNFNFNGNLFAQTLSATTYFGLPKDIYVTGGTYSSGTTIFTNNTGGTFSVSGFSTGGGVQYWSAGTGTDAITTLNSNNVANGIRTVAIGFGTQAIGDNSFAEGEGTQANGYVSHAEGSYTQAFGDYSHAEGLQTITSGQVSHAEGQNTQAFGDYSHAEGYSTIASGFASHAEGYYTQANGLTSFVHGYESIVNGDYSIVLGRNITGDTPDTTYVDRLNIKTLPIGTSINNLGIDSNGSVVIGTTGVRRKDVTYFSSGDITQNSVIQSNFITILYQNYKLKKIIVLFGEQSVDVNKTIPIDIKQIDTDSATPTNTLIYTANCNAIVGAIKNKVYTFDVDITLTTNKLLTVNTGAFTASTQILKNCLVTLVLEEI